MFKSYTVSSIYRNTLRALALGCALAVPLHGAALQAQDLRGAAALLIGALAAKGESRLAGLTHLYRGYEQPEQKLLRLGADIRRIVPIKDENNYRKS
jgi:UDP-N-acetylglucosamine enolpyruvyl transferase